MSIAEYLLDNCRGATIQGLTRDFVHALRIPLPPLPEQRRIAAILQEQLDALERARAATEAQLEAANALPAAYLRSVFNSPEAREWPRKSLGEMLSSPLKTGISKPTIPISDKWCLSLAAVRNGALDLSACKPVEVSDREAGGNWVKPGAFYVVRGNGNLSLVGRGALAPTEIKSPVLYPDLLIEVNPNPELIEPIFLRWAWDSQKVRSDIESRARTAAGIYKINQTNLASVCIPVPDLKVEKRLAAILSEQTTEVERLRKSLEAQLDAINKLPAALLRRAFRGELR
jgi:type I restriction enzyme S subunit